jgi:hypothetical protein
VSNDLAFCFTLLQMEDAMRLQGIANAKVFATRSDLYGLVKAAASRQDLQTLT